MKTILFSAVLLCAAITAPLAHGQARAVQVDVRRVEADSQKTPQWNVGGVKDKSVSSPRDWLEIEVEFDTKVDPRGEIIPSLLFKYYVVIQGKDGPKLLTGDVNHINVEPDTKLYSAVYVSPATLGAITGTFRRFQPSSVLAIGVEVFFNGVKVGQGAEGQSGDWWNRTQVPRQPGVLGKADTPFALLWLDRYADTAPTN